jgi:soluble lytic murein transglycosylase
VNRSVLKKSFPQKYENFVEKAEKEFSISRHLIWAIMRQESAFRETAVSPSKAYGLMQMLAGTARETARWLKVKNFRVPEDIFDPITSIRFGTHFISRMVGKYKGVIPLAVASYNVGPGNLDRWLRHRTDLQNWDQIGADLDDDIWMDELPWAETSFYVKAVMRNLLLYKVIHDKVDELSVPPWKEVLQ